MNKWTSFNDSSPPVGKYLCYTPCEMAPVAVFDNLSIGEGCYAWWRNGDCFCDTDTEQHGFDYCSEPTHWMELPLSPVIGPELCDDRSSTIVPFPKTNILNVDQETIEDVLSTFLNCNILISKITNKNVSYFSVRLSELHEIADPLLFNARNCWRHLSDGARYSDVSSIITVLIDTINEQSHTINGE